MADPDPQQPLFEISTVLLHLSGHLDRLDGWVHGVECELGTQISHDAPPQSATIIQLQSLDYLRQSLQDLGVLLASLSKVQNAGTVSEDEIATISTDLKLSGTRAILNPQMETTDYGVADPALGDLDFF